MFDKLSPSLFFSFCLSVSPSLPLSLIPPPSLSRSLGIAFEAEGNDRSDISLPGKQLQLLQDLASAYSQSECFRH